MSNTSNDIELASHEMSAARQSERARAPSIAIEANRVSLMHRILPAQTRDAINATFGISENTWKKVKKGEPIRASVAQRLIERIEALSSHYN